MPAPERHQPAGQLPCAWLEKDGSVSKGTLSEGTAKRREDGPAAEEVRWHAPARAQNKGRRFKKQRPYLNTILTDKHYAMRGFLLAND